MFAMKLFDRKRRSFFVLIGVVLLAMLFTACGAGGGTTGNGGGTAGPTGGNNGKGCNKIGVLLPESASSDRWEAKDHPLLQKDIEAVVGTGNVFIDNAQGSADTQLTQAESDLTKGACILVVAAHDSAQAASIVAKAKAQQVPVIAYDRLIQSKDLNYYVSFDNVKVGTLQGQYIVAHHKKGDNVVMINGSNTDNNAKLFYQGAMSALSPLYSSKELNKVYDQFTPDWNNDTARTEMDAALTKNHNNVQIAYVANDGMANSVIASLKAQKLNGKVVVTGQDATVAGIHNILAGDQSMTVYKAISKEAQSTADLVKAIINGSGASSIVNGQVATADGTNIPSVLETPVSVDKTNIASTVIADGYVSKSDVCQGIPAGTDGVC
ncbi:MAG: substrate-binding domain-containing protein [Ktedonobacteraceae bacterium]